MTTDKHVTRETFDKVMVPNYAPGKMIPVRGEGARVWDQEQREYLDFAGGIAVSALGHCHPAMVSALTEQAQRLWHVANVLTNEPALRLAELLTQHTFADKVFFANSGGEANEAAFKLARRYAWDHYGPEKNQIISFYNSFHGRTLFTVTVGGQAKYTEGFAPVPEGVLHAGFNDIESLKALMSERTCAVVVEPIQGEGGILPANHEFLEQVRSLCNEHKALLIFDEIQTGVGRTGALYAYMNSGVVPDILTTAKALGGGFPIAAMLTTDDIAASLAVGTHGSTYGGNPLGCAVAEAVLLEVLKPGVMEAVVIKGQQIRDGLAGINARLGVFKEIRGEGLLIGAELAEPWVGQAKAFMNAASDQGLLVLIAGPNVIRVAPSLLITEDQISQGLVKLEMALDAVLSGTDAE